MIFDYSHYFILTIFIPLCFCYNFRNTFIKLNDNENDRPQQIHISLGSNKNDIIITWTTYSSCNQTVVKYGIEPNQLNQNAIGNCNEFIDGGPKQRKHFIHRVRLSDLKPSMRYYYQCYSSDGFQTLSSTMYSFKTQNPANDWNARLLIFGDLGLENGQSIPRIKKEIDDNNVDLIIHVGDFAYDLDSNDSYVGDEFMRIIEPIAARVPYQTCPGNHEHKYNFSNYINRFTMYDMIDGNINNHYYTFNVGPIQFIAFSTEFYFFIQFGFAQTFRQYHWLEKTLINANKNRHERPWIITFGHRPMYCGNNNYDDCTRFESIIRKGWPYVGLGLEDLFYKYGVDMEIWAHEHSYERMWPVYNATVQNGTVDPNNPYDNAKAPVHLITGSAGCKERLDPFRLPLPWSAKRIVDYGYTKLTIINRTHLYIQQISDDLDGMIVDSFLMIKNHDLPVWLR